MVLREGEKGCIQFVLEMITHFSVTASMSGGGERRLIFDNFISNISPCCLDKGFGFCGFLCFVFILTEYRLFFFSPGLLC